MSLPVRTDPDHSLPSPAAFHGLDRCPSASICRALPTPFHAQLSTPDAILTKPLPLRGGKGGQKREHVQKRIENARFTLDC